MRFFLRYAQMVAPGLGEVFEQMVRKFVSGSEGYFVLAKEWKLWRALRSFPRRPVEAGFSKCNIHRCDPQCPVNFDSSRPECANSGRSATGWLQGHIDPNAQIPARAR
jgi:hypothetical protein